MSDVVDDDVMQAVEALWKADPVLGGVTLEQGRLKSPKAVPYAHLDCKPERRENADSGGSWFDWRKVEITIRGLKADVVRLVGVARGVFKHGLVLNYPSGARHLIWRPEQDAKVEQDENQKDGVDVWKGVITALCESTRRF